MTYPSDFMQDCDPEFENVGFDRDEIMPFIRQLQTDSNYVDTSGESYTTPALELLKKYIAAHWSTFDPNEPNSCTPKKDALTWLKRESSNFSEISQSMREAIDLIVRHPTARTRMTQKR